MAPTLGQEKLLSLEKKLLSTLWLLYNQESYRSVAAHMFDISKGGGPMVKPVSMLTDKIMEVVGKDATMVEGVGGTELDNSHHLLQQVMNLAPNELQWVCRHLGHTEKVHLAHYRTMSPFIERVSIGKVLLMQDLNIQKSFVGKKLDEVDFLDILKDRDALGARGDAVEDMSTSGDAVEDMSTGDDAKVDKVPSTSGTYSRAGSLDGSDHSNSGPGRSDPKTMFLVVLITI